MPTISTTTHLPDSGRLRSAIAAIACALACAATVSAAPAAPGAAREARVRVACIGDSITYGFGLADRSQEAYPAQLQKILDGRSPGKCEVRNFGNSGRGIYLDSMRGAEKRGFRWMPEHKAALAWRPDIVICNLGINDCQPLHPRLAAIATNRRSLERNGDFPCSWVAREYPRRKDNVEEARWWPVSAMYDHGIRRIVESGIRIDGILWYQGESNATTCVAPDTPTPEDYQLETLRAIVAELRGRRNVPFLMMGLPRMNRPWEQYRAVQKKVCAETGAIYVDAFGAGLGDMNDVHPRDKTSFAELAIGMLRGGRRN
ncbi:MAG: hypothetical protein IKO72_12840 [Kiritimatiellae bacterium]|nr:hypothetical protein [Kiritimatiellia bacterium]